MNEQLEKLIDLALVDGILTDKEKEVLYKKANEFNVDIDEFEMILNAKLHLKNNEAKPEKPQSQKEGLINKCPTCGEVLSSFLSKCPSCDYELRGKDANKIISEIEKKIEKVRADFEKRIANATKRADRDYLQRVEQYNAIGEVISNVSVPSTKEDLIEVISYCYPKRYDIHNAVAYNAKYKECLSKLEMLAISDHSLLPIIEMYKGKVGKENKKATLIIILSIIGIVTIAGLSILAFKYL